MKALQDQPRQVRGIGRAALRGATAAVAAFAVLSAVRPVPAGEPVVTSDVLRLKRVTSIDVSGDGARAVYAVQSIAEEPPANGGPDGAAGRIRGAGDARPRYAYRSHLFEINLRAAEPAPRQLTFGRRRDADPVLSPDGRRLAFVRLAEESGENGERRGQVWLLDLGGGEARQITTLEHGAFAPRWSPDGRHLLVHSSLPLAAIEGEPPWPAERPRRGWNDVPEEVEPRPDGTRDEIRAWLARNAEAFDPFVINRISFQGEQSLRREMRFTHLFVVEVDDPAAEPRRITDGFYDHSDARYLGDGSRIVYVTGKPATEHPDRVR
ncbi:MAG: TolB family protein, partial [Planctomycetota bacterium]